ncbi:MAG: M23 family metallopeptidase [Candidatus Woesearchaeota archaeon]
MLKKSQITIIILFSILLILFIIFLGFYNFNKLKDKEIQQKNNELFTIKKDTYIAYSNNCLEKIFKKAIDEFGFETELIKQNYEKEFISCLENNDLIDLEINEKSLMVDVLDSESIISINIKLETKLKYENLYEYVNEYKYDFSKISFKNLKLENNKLAFDTQIISSDENAILYLKKDTSFSLNNNPVSQISIKVDKKPEFSFIIGDFIYDLSPDDMKSNDLIILKIKYKDEWLNHKGQKINPKKLRIAYLEEQKKEWRFLPSIVNPEKKEISILTNHFSKYVIGYLERDIPLFIEKDNVEYIAGFSNIDDENTAIITQKSEFDTLSGDEKCPKDDFEIDEKANIKKKRFFYSENLIIQDSFCIDPFVDVIYEITEFNGNLYELEISTRNEVNIEKSKKDNRLFIKISSSKKQDISLIIKKRHFLNLETLIYPDSTNMYIYKCYADLNYLGKGKQFNDKGKFHTGIDIATISDLISPCNAELIDIWNTKIDFKNTKNYYKEGQNNICREGVGPSVILKCFDSNIFVLFFHLDKEYLKKIYKEKELGEIIKKGEIIGKPGTTEIGCSDGTHTHVEFRTGKIDENLKIPLSSFSPCVLRDNNYLVEDFFGYALIDKKKITGKNCCDVSIQFNGLTENEFFASLNNQEDNIESNII